MMCGIAGIYNIGSKERASEFHLEKMCRFMVHRGPDEKGYYTNGPIGLGHRRLSIIDIETGKQPMANSSETTWIVFNGEIYNFRSLRDELTQKGHKFKTKSDTEAIIYAYDEWGESCVEHLEGTFAFAIWDNKRRKLFAARDRFGISPFFYYWDGKTFSFASHIESLLTHDDVDESLNHEAVMDYFHLGFILAPKTIYRSIQKLPQGHSLSVDENGLRMCKYWDLADAPCGDLNPSDEEALSQFDDFFQKTIVSRLESDVPLGAFLSGGVDSTAVVQGMANVARNRLVTCSIRFQEKEFDESRFSLDTARRLKTEHHLETVDADLSSIDILKKLISFCGEPFGDSSMIPTYYVSQLARKHVTVSLSGDGGDETLGGYPRYPIDVFEEKMGRLVPSFLKCFFYYFLTKAKYFNRGPLFYLSCSAPEAYFWGFSAIKPFESARFSETFIKSISSYHPKNVYREIYAKVKKWDFFSAMQYLDISTYLVDDGLIKVDRMSMANSLEARSPFFNHRMVEWFFRLPRRFKYRSGQGKWIAKEWLRKQGYSKDYLYRKKQGFSIPEAQWLKTVYKDVMEKILEDTDIKQIFNIEILKKDWRKFLDSNGQNSFFWWNLLVFGLWKELRTSNSKTTTNN